MNGWSRRGESGDVGSVLLAAAGWLIVLVCAETKWKKP